MASNKTRVNSPAAEECTYPVEELVKAHKALGESYEIVAIALKMAGVETSTIAEAKEIIEKFKKQEVK